MHLIHFIAGRSVAAAYGWSDLDLGHGFHATKQGERYTLSELLLPARVTPGAVPRKTTRVCLKRGSSPKTGRRRCAAFGIASPTATKLFVIEP